MPPWVPNEWIRVSSKNLLEVRYRQEVRRLDVIFCAAINVTYTYDNVSYGEWIAMMDADSVGGAFNRLIRGRPELHPYRKRKSW